MPGRAEIQDLRGRASCRTSACRPNYTVVMSRTSGPHLLFGWGARRALQQRREDGARGREVDARFHQPIRLRPHLLVGPSTTTSCNTSATPTKWDDFVVRGSREEGKLIGFDLLDGLPQRAVGLDRGATPSRTPTRRRDAPASSPCGPDPPVGSSPTSEGRGRSRGRPAVESWLGVREQGDVRATRRGEGAVEQRQDQLADIGGREAGTSGNGPTQYLGVEAPD